MTKKEKIVATAYTGTMFIDGSLLGELYAYEEEKLGRGVLDIMHADKDFVQEVRDAVKTDFIDMLNGRYEKAFWRYSVQGQLVRNRDGRVAASSRPVHINEEKGGVEVFLPWQVAEEDAQGTCVRP